MSQTLMKAETAQGEFNQVGLVFSRRQDQPAVVQVHAVIHPVIGNVLHLGAQAITLARQLLLECLRSGCQAFADGKEPKTKQNSAPSEYPLHDVLPTVMTAGATLFRWGRMLRACQNSS